MPSHRLIEWDEFEFSDCVIDNVNGLHTPLGILKLTEENNPISKYRIFIARTNFTITEKEAILLNEIPGIEMVHIFSRYTFIVAIGNLFNWSDCKIQIEYFLCQTHINDFQIQNIENESIKMQVIETKHEISKFNNWAIYICPNGAIKHIESEESTSDYKSKLQTLKDAMIISKGLLLSSEFQ